MTQEWFLCMLEKIWPLAGLLRPENLSWPNLAFCRKFHKTKVVGHTQQWVCVLNNIFGLHHSMAFWGCFFIFQPLIEAARPL